MAVQLEVLGAEADQQVAAAVLRRCSGGRADELERRATELEAAVVGFRGREVHGGEPMKAATKTLTGLS